MAILEQSTPEDFARLLELFPVTRLKDAFNEFDGLKDEISEAAAKAAGTDRILAFVAQNFARCKLHVYVFPQPAEDVDLLTAFPNCEVVAIPDPETKVIFTRVVYKVLLKDPYENATIEFLWPMRIRHYAGHVVLSIIVFERGPLKYFDRGHSVGEKSVDEKQIVRDLAGLCGGISYLHMGLKKLWEEWKVDAFKVSYKEPGARSFSEMDEEKGIRETDPAKYELLKGCTLFNTMFKTKGEVGGVKVFQANASTGHISFPRYTEGEGDTDDTVRAILDANA